MINDVVVGVIFLGMRLYMQEMSEDSGKAQTTALVCLILGCFEVTSQ